MQKINIILKLILVDYTFFALFLKDIDHNVAVLAPKVLEKNLQKFIYIPWHLVKMMYKAKK